MPQIIPNWHPIFVHFTVALLTVAAGFLILAWFSKDKCRFSAKLHDAGLLNLWLGAALSAVTVALGFYAYNTVTHDTPSHAAMTEHRNWALLTFVFILVAAGVAWWRARTRVSRALVGLMLVVAPLVGVTAWHGGELVYRYGLGVMALPKHDGQEGHAHDHGADGHGDMESAPSPGMPPAAVVPHGSPGETHVDDGHHDAPATKKGEPPPHDDSNSPPHTH